MLGDLASAPAHVATDCDARWTLPSNPSPLLRPQPHRLLRILSWLIILWAHGRIWCIAHCHITGKIFILLVLHLVSVVRQGWCIIQKAPQKHCVAVYNKTLYVSKWNMILIDTVVVFTWQYAIGLNSWGFPLSKEQQPCETTNSTNTNLQQL